MKFQETVINFAVYEDKTEFMGIADVQLPDLTSLTQQLSGAGIAGNIEAIIPGHFEAMTMTMNFRTTTAAALKLSEPRRHNIDIRVANQMEDTVAGKIQVEAIIPGHFEAMTMTMNFRTTTAAALKLSEPRRHNIDIRVANQMEDTVAGKIQVESVKHVLVVIPKKDGGGKLAAASATDASGEYAVRYWATYVDGKKIREIDPMNSICLINGTDYLVDVRKALGK